MRAAASRHPFGRDRRSTGSGRAAPGVSRIKLVILFAVVLIGAVAFVAVKKPFGAAPAKQPEQKPTSFVALGEFLVNLSDGDALRFLKTEITVEIEGMSSGEGGEHGDSDEDPQTARMRDVTVIVLSDATFDDLQASGGKERLKEQLRTAITEELEDAQVRSVLFTSFVMQ